MKKVIAILLLMVLIACAAKEAPAPEQPKAQIEEIQIVQPSAMPENPEYEPPPTAPTENTT